MNFKRKKYIVLLLCVLVLIMGMSACGKSKNSSENTYAIIIHINYEESSGFNYKDDAKLFVDNIEIADVPYGSEDNYEVKLTEGTHTIYLKRNALFRKNSTNSIEINVSKDNTYISITAKENAISGLRISEDPSSEPVTSYTLPSDTPYEPASAKPAEEDNAVEDFFNSFLEDWNKTDVPSDIANHAFDLALRLYIQQYFIPAVNPYASYDNIIKNDDALNWEPVELVESPYNDGFYFGTMDLNFYPDMVEIGMAYSTTETFEFNYNPDTSYVTIYGRSWSISRNLLDTDYTDDPNHVALNMTNLPTDVIFDVAEASCLYFIKDIVLPDVGMSNLDEFYSSGCTYEYDREGSSGIKIIQIGDISYSLSMSIYVNATTEKLNVMDKSPVYYEDVTIYFDAENVGKADQALTAFYFSWLDDGM